MSTKTWKIVKPVKRIIYRSVWRNSYNTQCSFIWFQFGWLIHVCVNLSTAPFKVPQNENTVTIALFVYGRNESLFTECALRKGQIGLITWTINNWRTEHYIMGKEGIRTVNNGAWIYQRIAESCTLQPASNVIDPEVKEVISCTKRKWKRNEGKVSRDWSLRSRLNDAYRKLSWFPENFEKLHSKSFKRLFWKAVQTPGGWGGGGVVLLRIFGGWVCAARFSKPCPLFRPSYVKWTKLIFFFI